MGYLWYLALLVLTIILLIVSGVYATKAAVELTQTHGYNDDGYLKRAHTFVTWAAVVTWLSIGLTIIVIILAVVGGIALFSTGVGEAGVAAEAAEGGELATLGEGSQSLTLSKGLSPALILAILLVGALSLTDGILAALAANEMRKSKRFTPSNPAYTSAIVAAVTGIGGIGLIIFSLVIYWAVREHEKRRVLVAREKEAIEQQRATLELAALQAATS